MWASTVYYLIGLPGVGKFTVARTLERLATERGQDLAVVDNRYVNNVVFRLVDGRQDARAERRVGSSGGCGRSCPQDRWDALPERLVVRFHQLPRPGLP